MTAATAWASGALTLFAVRFVSRLGEAGAFPAATRAMQPWFPKQERGLVQGVTHCFSRLAVAVTPAIAVAIMTALGWRWVFYMFAGIGIVWSVWFAAAYRNRPEEHQGVNAGELAHIRGAAVASGAGVAAAVSWKAILHAPNTWAIAAAYFCFFYGAYFYLTWFPTYLIEYRICRSRTSVCWPASRCWPP
jgi:MFS family permease